LDASFDVGDRRGSDSVHTEEPWRTIEANTLKVEEQIVDERSARTHRSPHCLAYADDTGIDTTARERHLISQTAFSHRASLEQPGPVMRDPSDAVVTITGAIAGVITSEGGVL
jgi:hypothetical protein